MSVSKVEKKSTKSNYTEHMLSVRELSWSMPVHHNMLTTSTAGQDPPMPLRKSCVKNIHKKSDMSVRF